MLITEQEIRDRHYKESFKDLELIKSAMINPTKE